MLKKILVGLLVILMFGAIVVGIVELVSPSSLTLAYEENRGIGQQATMNPYGPGGSQRTPNEECGRDSSCQDTPRERGSGGQGNRGWQSGSESSITQADGETIQGTAVETLELVIKMTDGKTVQIGLGPSHYRDSQGFTIRAGDQIQANGYWEDDEFKAVQAVNLTTGTQITLRDASGRPMWAGWGRRK